MRARRVFLHPLPEQPIHTGAVSVLLPLPRASPSLLRRYTVVFVDIALACYYNKKVKMAFVRRLAAAPNK